MFVEGYYGSGKHICEALCLLDNPHITEEHLRWVYLK